MGFQQRLLSASSLVVAASLFAPELAQAQIETVVVTAMKRGENVQDVPASITALSGEQLRERGITNVEQLATYVPGLTYGVHDGASFITLRGVGSTINSGVSETTVATYVDGLFLPRSTMGTLQQVDLERVEVLRGPQGTLYGRNATGGAINFISAAPTDELSGEINVSTGSRSGYGVSGFVSGPLDDDLGFRLSGGYTGHKSYLVNINPSQPRTTDVTAGYGRAALKFEPTSDLTIDLSAKYERDDGADTNQQLFSLPTSPIIPPGTPVSIAPNRTGANYPFSQRIETFITTLTVNWKISEAVSLRSISGYINHHAITSFDGDTTGFDFQNADGFVRSSNSVSQEFVLLGDVGNVQWLGGVYLYHENWKDDLPVAVPPAGILVNLNLAHEGTDSLGLYTDVTWSVTDDFRINGGLRYNAERKEFLYALGIFLLPSGPCVASCTLLPSSISSYRFLPKINAQYDINDDVHTYVQFQEGFKSGGHDIGGDTTFGPEDLKAYEAGLKSQWLDGAVTANFSVYYYDYKGLQITNNTGPTTTKVENADAKMYGLEAELTWQANEDVSVFLAPTLEHSEYTNFMSFDAARPLLGLIDLKGVQVIQSPNWTVKTGAQWRIPLGAGFVSNVVLRGDVAYTDDVPLRYFAQPTDIQKSYALVNLSATFNSEDEMTALRVFANNVGDEKYKRMIDYLGGPGAFDGNYGEPATWGVQLTHRM